MKNRYPEPTIEFLKKIVETNLLNDGFILPYAILCTFTDRNVGFEITNSNNDQTTKKISISKVLNALDEIKSYKVILIHESWRYEKPKYMKDIEFEEIVNDSERCDFLEKEEAYTITEITKENIRMLTKQYYRTEYNTINFKEKAKITEIQNMKTHGYNNIQCKLVTMN